MSIPRSALAVRVKGALAKLTVSADAVQAACVQVGDRASWIQVRGQFRGLSSQAEELVPLLDRNSFNQAAFGQLLHEILQHVEECASAVLPAPANASTEWPSLWRYQKDPSSCAAVLGTDPSRWIKVVEAWVARMADCATPLPVQDTKPAAEVSDMVKKLYTILKKYSAQCHCNQDHGRLLRMASHGMKNRSRSEYVFDLLHQPTTSFLHAQKQREFCVSMRLERAAKELRFACDGAEKQSSPLKAPERQVPIKNICDSLRKFPARATKLSCKNGRLWQHHGPGLPLKYTSQEQSVMLDITQVLQTVSASEVAVLGAKCRWSIAATVTHAFYHLHGSDWIPATWSKDAVKFPTYDGKLILKPFLSETSSTIPIEAPEGFITDRPTFELGVFLLELFCHESLQDMAGYEDVNAHLMTLYDFISEKFAEVEDEFDDNEDNRQYLSAVRMCLIDLQLSKDLSLESTPFDEQDFRENFFTEVVQPLEADCLQRFEISPDSLDRMVFIIDSNESGQVTEIILDDDGDHDQSFKSSLQAAQRLSAASSLAFFDGPSSAVEEQQAQSAKSWFEQLSLHTSSLFKGLNSSDEPIRVAILDTGVNPEDPFLRMKQQKGSIEFEDFTGIPNIATVDTHGHGTQVTRLVLKTAPRAKVFVARICQESQVPSAQIVAKAIRHAVTEWDVDIINMSFGYPSRTDDNQCIHDAITEAYAKGKLMFAASRNDGANRPIAYPASEAEVICIHSADGQGNAAGFNPSSTKRKQWSILGQGTSSGSGKDIKYYSGTSFAAPVAAGIGALILEFVRASPETSTKNQSLKRLRSTSGMEKILKKMSEKRGDHRVIVPWLLFRQADKQDIEDARTWIRSIIESELWSI